MSTCLHRVPRLSLHLMAFGWSAAILVTVASLIRLPVPIWLFALAYLLPALARQRSDRLSILAAVIVAALAALVVPPESLFFAILLLLLQSARPLTLSHQATVSFLRIEQRRGISLLLLVVLARAIAGRPSAWLIALCALLYLVGALAGLPVAHSREAGDTRPQTAKLGLQLSLVITAVAAVISAIIGVVRLAAEHHVFDFLGPILAAVFKPIAYVLGYVVQFFVGLLLRRRPKLPKQGKNQLKPQSPHFPQHAHSAAVMQHLEIVLIVVAAAVLVLLVYLLYRRVQAQEPDQAPDPNAPAPGEELARNRALRRRRNADYGEGARRMVRRTVGLHVRGQPLPPGTTARNWAKSQAWDDELLATYEHARYGFVEPFPESKARAFVVSFQQRFRSRNPRRKDPDR